MIRLRIRLWRYHPEAKFLHELRTSELRELVMRLAGEAGMGNGLTGNPSDAAEYAKATLKELQEDGVI